MSINSLLRGGKDEGEIESLYGDIIKTPLMQKKKLQEFTHKEEARNDSIPDKSKEESTQDRD